jgi:hypothetical protein
MTENFRWFLNKSNITIKTIEEGKKGNEFLKKLNEKIIQDINDIM